MKILVELNLVAFESKSWMISQMTWLNQTFQGSVKGQGLLMELQADPNQVTRSSLNMALGVLEGFWRVKDKEKISLGFLSSH